jgi:hypothetical protein
MAYLLSLRARLRRQRREIRFYRLLLIASTGALCFFLFR